MGGEENIKTIQSIYEAFARGDVQVILDGLTDDVDWAADTSSTSAPWYGVRRNKADVARFFQEFGSSMDVEEFTPITYAANDTDALTVVRCRAKSRATGKSIDMNLHHYFRFSGSQIAYYRGTEDTAQTEAALRS
jgi:hypothetical protein